MSVKVISWVWESSRSEGTDRLVLLAIADHASDAGGDAWPSVETLARKAAVSVRTVQRCVKSLVTLGELQVVSNGGQNGVNLYRVLMTDPRQSDTPVNLTPRQIDTGKDVPKQGRNRTENPVNLTPPSTSHPVTLTPKPSSKRVTKEGGSVSSSLVRDDVDRICNHLADRIEANGSRRPRIAPKWHVDARLLIDKDGRTEQQIHNAIDWCQAHPFWRGVILSMPKLREKYDQLRLQAEREREAATRPANGRSTTDERVMSTLALADRLDAKHEPRKELTG